MMVQSQELSIVPQTPLTSTRNFRKNANNIKKIGWKYCKHQKNDFQSSALPTPFTVFLSAGVFQKQYACRIALSRPVQEGSNH